MTATPVERVVSMLVAAQYKAVQTPLPIAGLSFDFSAVLVGPPRSADLIVVADAATESERRIVQRVEGLARALDALRSRRPMTLILTGPRLRQSALDALSRVCRVLGVDDASDAVALKNAIAVLLPLDLPEAEEDVEEGRLPAAESHDEIVRALVAEAANGEDAVKERLYELIEEPFDDEAGVS